MSAVNRMLEARQIGTTRATVARALRANALTTLAQYVVMIAVFPVILRYVGPALYGAWAAMIAVLAVGALADAGIRTEIARRVGTALGQRDGDELQRAVRTGVGLLVISASAILIVGEALVPAIRHFVFPGGVTGYSASALDNVLRAAILLTALTLVADGYLSVLRGVQRSDVQTLATLLGLVVGAAATVALAAAGYGLWSLLLGQVTQAVMRSAVQWVALRRLLPEVRFRIIWPTTARARSFLGLSGLLLLLQVSDVIDSQWDRVALARFVGPASVAFFSIGVLLVLQAKTIVVLAVTPVLAAVAELQHRQQQALERVYLLFARVGAVIATGLLAGLFILGPDFFRLWLGPGYSDAGTAVRLFTIAVALNLVIAAPSLRCIGHGWHRTATLPALVNVVVNGVVSYTLAARIGFVGPLIGSIAGNGVGTAMFYVLLLRRTRDRWVVPPLAAVSFGAGVAAITVALGLDNPADWLSFSLTAAVMAVILIFGASFVEHVPVRALYGGVDATQDYERPPIESLRAHLHARRPGWQLLDLAARFRDRTNRSLSEERRLRTEINHALENASHTVVSFPHVRDPLVSVVIPVFNNWRLTVRCLGALCATAPLQTLEVIIVDDHSTDETPARLRAIPGLRVLTNDRNQGFTQAANQGMREARGGFVFLLNNDTLPLPGCIEALLDAMGDRRIGAAGARLLYPTGQLQEAGSLIWNDASGWNLGRGRNPAASAYGFRRDVDYCSAAALMVRSMLLRDVGYFDERFAPAYYEDTDLCFSVRSRGYRVVCEPSAIVMHEEGMTHGTEHRAGLAGAHSKANQERNRASFASKWAVELAAHVPPPPRYSTIAELQGSSADAKPRVLVCDVTVPTADRDSGSQRMEWILRLLAPMCGLVTLAPTLPNAYTEYRPPLQREGVEIIDGHQPSFRRLMRRRAGFYDVVILSRALVARRALRAVRRYQPSATVVFDTVDIKSLRLEREVRTMGESREGSPQRQRTLERHVIRRVDVTATVSEDEAALVQRMCPGAKTLLLPNVHQVAAALPPPFAERRGLLFIGSFAHPPNSDAVLWFATDVLPIVRRHLDVTLRVVGPEASRADVARWGPHVRYEGWVPDVTPLFDRARVSVVPLLYGAGVKGKVGQAMALGLPVVTTTTGAEGMDLTDGYHALIRDDAESFAAAVVELHEDERLWQSVADSARDLVRRRWAPAAMEERLKSLLHHAGAEHRAPPARGDLSALLDHGDDREAGDAAVAATRLVR